VNRHSEARIVPHPVEVMYAIVADVGRYPEFLPWVTSLTVKSREWIDTREMLLAEMSVGFGALSERYTSRVMLDPERRRIDVAQTDGPFRVLENHWQFTPDPKGCRVDFAIAFEFRSRLLDAIASAAFERVMLKMTGAFEARARVLSDQAVQKREGGL